MEMLNRLPSFGSNAMVSLSVGMCKIVLMDRSNDIWVIEASSNTYIIKVPGTENKACL